MTRDAEQGIKALGFSGSLQAQLWNTLALRAAREHASEGMDVDILRF